MHAEQAYLFRHTILRETAYELQLPTVRARLHAMVLQIFEAMHGGAPPPAKFRLGRDLEAVPHSLDTLATELAEHALRGQALTSNLHALRLQQERYLLRAVWCAERDYYNTDALKLWLSLAEVARMDRDNAREAGYLCHASAAAILTGKPEQAEELAVRAIVTAGAEPGVRLQGVLLGRLGRAQRELGKPDLSLKTMQQAVEMLNQAEEQELALSVRTSIAIALREIGQTEEAEAINDEIAAAALNVGALKLVGNAIGNQVGVYMQTGRAPLALDAAKRSLAIHRQAGNRRSEGITLGNLAILQRAAGAYGDAEQSFAEGLAINREVGDRNSEGRTLSNLGNLHVARGQHDLAETCFREAIAILRELGIRRDEAVALGNYATFLTQIGQLAEAEAAFERALKLHREVGNRRHEGAHLMDYAACLLASRHEASAVDVWQQGARIVQQLGDADLLNEKITEMRAMCTRAGIPPFEAPV